MMLVFILGLLCGALICCVLLGAYCAWCLLRPMQTDAVISVRPGRNMMPIDRAINLAMRLRQKVE